MTLILKAQFLAKLAFARWVFWPFFEVQKWAKNETSCFEEAKIGPLHGADIKNSELGGGSQRSWLNFDQIWSDFEEVIGDLTRPPNHVGEQGPKILVQNFQVLKIYKIFLKFY